MSTSASDGASAGVSASAVIVKQALAQEEMVAPRGRFDVVCLTAKPGLLPHVQQVQAEIALLREQGQPVFRNWITPFGRRKLKRAQQLHDEMCRDLMVEKWRDVCLNIVTTVGKNDLLDKYFAGSSYTATPFCGLISSVGYSAVAAADTMASHAGWNEAQGATNLPDYTGNRPALSFANAASGGVKATSAASSFTFTSAGTIKGMFNNTITTKNGTTGVLYNAVLFTGGDRTVAISDVVNVNVTYTIT